MSDNSALERVVSLNALPLPEHAVVIADRRLPDSVLAHFPDPLLVEAGEGLKTLAAVEVLASAILQRRSSRPLTLVAVGGGSVGDAVGFIASILWRGVSLWHVPTTLLAMVDSAHGGKTAVNLGPAKNQLGTFYPAERVYIVEEFLRSLPPRQRREGVVELLKTLWLGDPDGVRALNGHSVEDLAYAPLDEVTGQLGNMIEAAVAIKQRIVAEDPREEIGVRTLLNLGHTLGHALELTTGLGHGAAVAWGMEASLQLSAARGMPAADVRHCRETLFPLLVPLQHLPARGTLLAAMMKDKKRSNDRLRSVILRGIGDPVVIEDITPDDWVTALEEAAQAFRSAVVTVHSHAPRMLTQQLEASKSELNRALIIAAQRSGRTCILGKSSADDVTSMIRALRQLGYPVEETAKGYVVDNVAREPVIDDSDAVRSVHVGEGGTTLRFLLALCSTNVKRTKLFVAPALMRRPHEALIRALRSGGASIDRFDDASGMGYIVRGWHAMPQAFSVDPSDSSQFVSALAMLAAGAERPFTIRLLAEPVSRTYLDMTLSMLEQAGVEAIVHKDLIALNQTERLREKLTLEAELDASSQAVWAVARFLGHPAEPGRRARIPRQPDSAVDRYLSQLREATRASRDIDLSDVPDLLPVLTVAALTLPHPVTFSGAAHLRNKESNRLDAFAASLQGLGASVEALEDGLRVHPSAGAVQEGLFRSHGDHRLVMAAVLLSHASGVRLRVDEPWAVSKSYPAFWDDVRRAGWSVSLHQQRPRDPAHENPGNR